MPLPPANGSVLPGNTNTTGAVWAFTCNPGYMLSGPANSTCSATGLWVPATTVCSRAPCVAPTPPANGSLACSGQAFGDVCAVQCPTATKPVTPTLACLSTGVWSSDAQCVPVLCPALAAPANGSVSTSVNASVGTVATFSCAIGFQVSGVNTTACLVNGSWATAAPLCSPVTCPTLPSPDTNTTCPQSSYGQSCTFSCPAGFRLLGSSTVVCTAQGQWSGAPPQCQAITCSGLPSIAFGQPQAILSNAPAALGTTVSFACQEGYVLQGGAARCSGNGTWAVPSICAGKTPLTISQPDMLQKST